MSSIVVFVEGKEANSDKRILQRLIGDANPSVSFIAGESCDSIIAVGTKANKLLEEASANGDLLVVVDRDYRSDEDFEDARPRYQGRVFMWKVHEIENLFLAPGIVFETLRINDQLGTLQSEAEVRRALQSAASELREWIAADWVRWETQRRLTPPEGFISKERPLASLLEYGTRIVERMGPSTVPGGLEELYVKKLGEVDTHLNGGRWLERLPGKQMLKAFLSRHTRFNAWEYLSAAVGVVLTKDIRIDEVERLRKTIEYAQGRS